MKMKMKQQWLHVVVAAKSQNTVAGSRCQVVDDIPSQDQVADEMLARLYHTAPIRLR